MVVVDTGSVDETPRIAAALGARVFHFPRCDDFSAARNESLRHARGGWVFWMDSDDTIDSGCGRGLRRLAYQDSDPAVLGYVVQVHCPGGGADGDPDVTAVDHVKLIRNRPDLRFEGRIHEQILPAIRRAGGDVAWTDLYVVHSGSDHSPEGQERKRRRDFRLLDLELAERPGHPFTLFNLGMTHADAGQFEEAAGFLRRSIARSTPGESHLRKAYALLVYALMRRDLLDEATVACREGRRLFPEDPELRFREGVLLHDLGRLAESARAYLDVLRGGGERHFTSIDRGVTGYKARHNLAVVYTDMGELGEAERRWREVVREVPAYRHGWRGLGDCLLRQGRHGEAGELAARLAGDGRLRVEGLMLTARVAEARGDPTEARGAWGAATAAGPDDLDALRGSCQFCFEHGPADEAERLLRDLARREPGDASVHHNLGTLLLQTKRYAPAVESFRESLRLRPAAAATYLHLGYALKGGGRSGEAVRAWQEVLRLEPGHPAAREEIRHAGARVEC
jgi:tetratricopeptide (TPR) repeat protein